MEPAQSENGGHERLGAGPGSRRNPQSGEDYQHGPGAAGSLCGNSVLSCQCVDGDSVLRLLVQTESELPGEWNYLQGFRRYETQPPPNEEAIDTSLGQIDSKSIRDATSDWAIESLIVLDLTNFFVIMKTI